MRLVRSLCAAGCGLLAGAVPLVATADDPFAAPTLVAVSARSEYPNLGGLMQPAESELLDDETPASYLQYEPQNVPLEAAPPELFDEVPPLAEPSVATPQKLPPIVPYSTQFSIAWGSGSGDGLGIVTFDIREVLAVPRWSGFLLTPGFASHLLSGPESTDLPPVVYDNWVEVRWLKKLNNTWTMDLSLTPSLFTDYQNTRDGAFRLPARAIALYTRSPQLQIAAGVLFLDREDVIWLPAAGLIWSPSNDCKVEVLFPRPRVLYRLSGDEERSRWAYIGGEFGGGSWGIQRSDQFLLAPKNDIVTYSVLRFLVGLESRRKQGFSPRVEAGFSFNRKIEYRSGIGDYDPPNAAILRVGGSF